MSDFPPLYEVANEVVAKESTVESAVKALKHEVLKRPGYRDWLLESTYETAIYEAIYNARHTERRAIKNIPQCVRAPEASDVLLLASARTLLDSWKLPDGTLLGDAKSGQLAGFAEHERRIGNGHYQNADLYSSLATRIGRKTVRRAMTVEQVNALWTAIRDKYQVTEEAPTRKAAHG